MVEPMSIQVLDQWRRVYAMVVGNGILTEEQWTEVDNLWMSPETLVTIAEIGHLSEIPTLHRDTPELFGFEIKTDPRIQLGHLEWIAKGATPDACGGKYDTLEYETNP